eukprot:362671-Chlamydomonas_euryale.AAC.11
MRVSTLPHAAPHNPVCAVHGVHTHDAMAAVKGVVNGDVDDDASDATKSTWRPLAYHAKC